MCLILFAIDKHPDYRLLLAANRDEFYQRPTRQAQFWPDHPELLAGYDHQAHGTWLGVSRSGRLAAVTNIRDGIAEKKPDQRSRGLLTRDYLLGRTSAQEYLHALQQDRQQYPGFNLLLGDSQGFYFYNNEENRITQLQPGIYGLSNGTLNSPWPKLLRAKQQLADLIGTDPNANKLLTLLSDRHQPADNELPATGVPIEWERLLASCFIQSEHYGTRASTALLWHRNNEVEFIEQNFDQEGVCERGEYRFTINAKVELEAE